MLSNPLQIGKSRGLSAVTRMLRLSAPFFSVTPQLSNGLLDLNVDPLQSFEEHRTAKHAFSYLNTVATTGLFSRQTLDQFYEVLSIEGHCIHKHLLYYLASLYLQVGENDRVRQLLMSTGAASPEMSWFAALMLYARRNGFEIPIQNVDDEKCLEFLEQRLIDSASAISEEIVANSSVAIIGNAPSANMSICADDDVSFCFNNYTCNQRITGTSVFHVVTPSWELGQSAGESRLFITGNNIFHRRSRVWRRFSDCQYQSVSCFPKELWSRLYLQLKAPPSAGLLMMSCLSEITFPDDVAIVVTGFSESTPLVNHDYDRVPASSRHNWDEEAFQRKVALEILQAKAASLHCITG